MKNTVKILFLFLFFVMAAQFIGGCARTVTQLPAVGGQLSVEIKFRGDVDTVNNKYYIVFAPSSPLRSSKNYYFFAPGDGYDLNKTDVLYASTEVSYYYNNYFYSWMDFIILKDMQYFISNGPYVSAASHEAYAAARGHLAYRVEPSGADAKKKINLDFYLSRLSVPLPEPLYFTFICVDPNGVIRDLLLETNSIPLTSGATVSNTEISDLLIDPSLDIISWSVTVP